MLNQAANIAQIISIIVPAFFGVYAIWRKIDKRQTDAYIMSVRISDKLEFIEQQFGPNGGGLCEAVNTMSAKVDTIDVRLNKVDTEVSRLAGRFDQHIIEANK